MLSFLKRKKPNNDAEGTRVPSVQEYLGIKDIQDGIIFLKDGGYRLLIEAVGSVNYMLLSEAEQDAMESFFSRFLSSLNFPVQFYTQTRPLDLTGQTEELMEKAANLNPNLQQYARGFIRYLSYWATSGVLVKHTYIVIPVDDEDDYYIARQELLRRRDLVVGELQKWVACRALGTKEVLDVLYTAFNKGDAAAMKASDAEKHGFLDPVVRGVKLQDVRAAFSQAQS